MKITLMSSINLKNFFKGAKLMDNESKMEEILNRVMKLEMTQSKHDLEEIKATIKDITSTPKRRYETVIGAIITTLVGGIIGYCLVKLNLK